MHAISEKQFPIARYLIEQGADLYIKNNQKLNAIDAFNSQKSNDTIAQEFAQFINGHIATLKEAEAEEKKRASEQTR